jgi:predicted nucleic acid-binding protein
MIILDTNVLGALMRTVPDVAIVAWLDRLLDFVSAAASEAAVLAATQ